jgi:hypothetical protein
MCGSPTTLDQRHSDPDHDGADTNIVPMFPMMN